MTPEIWTIIGVGVAIAALILNGQRAARADKAELRSDIQALRRDVGELRRDVGELRERMARIEGLFEGFTGRSDRSAA